MEVLADLVPGHGHLLSVLTWWGRGRERGPTGGLSSSSSKGTKPIMISSN